LNEPSSVKVTVLKRLKMEEVFKESPVKAKYNGPCDAFKDGQKYTFGAEKTPQKPERFCSYAWDTLFPWILMLRFNGNLEFYEDKGVAVVSCADGLRPVIFKLERIET
jgi:uncharacterized repeat protein (TIGR04076 family)